MVIALYGVAFAMVAAGLTAVVRGYDIIVVERGWTLVIAGTVAASAGVLLFGIAYAAGRINRLVAETARLRERTGRGEVAYPPPPPNLAGAAPSSAPVPPGALDLPPAEAPSRPTLPPVGAALAGGAALGAAGLAAASTPRDGEDGPGQGDRPDASAPQEDGIGANREDVSRADLDRSDLDRANLGELDDDLGTSRPVDLDEAAGRHDLTGLAADTAPSDLTLPERGFALAGSDDGPPSDDGLFAEGDDAVLDGPALSPALDAEADRLGRDDADEIAAPDQYPPEEQLSVAAPDEPEAPPIVVGTYSSGGNNYVMYADGSIEADTPEGLFKFASLDELKEFIASGGEDRAVRP